MSWREGVPSLPELSAACLWIDASGNFVSSLIGHGRGSRLDVLDGVCFLHLLGIFCGTMTQYVGFLGFCDDYKWSGRAGFKLRW